MTDTPRQRVEKKIGSGIYPSANAPLRTRCRVQNTIDRAALRGVCERLVLAALDKCCFVGEFIALFDSLRESIDNKERRRRRRISSEQRILC